MCDRLSNVAMSTFASTSVTNAMDMLRELLAEVSRSRLTAREPLILELNRCVAENTAVLAASLDTNDLLIAERDSLRTTVAAQAAALLEVKSQLTRKQAWEYTPRTINSRGYLLEKVDAALASQPSISSGAKEREEKGNE